MNKWQRLNDTDENHFLNGQNYPHQNFQVSGMLTLTQSSLTKKGHHPQSLKTSNWQPQLTVSFCLCRSYIVINMCNKPTKFIKVTQTQNVVR